MNNTVKKIVASITVLTCAVWMMGPGVAQALTVSELLALIAGASSLEDLQADIAAAQATEGEVVTIEGVPADFTFETNLKQTSTGDDVKYLQIVLNSDSDTQLAESGVGSAGNETSYFGPLTKAAVIAFQELYTEDCLASWGLTEGTGFVGSTTRAKLNSLLAAAEEEEEEEEEEPPAGVLTVALSAATPAASILPDESMAVFAKFSFANGEEEDITINSLKLKRTGVGATSDLENVYLYAGAVRLTSGRSVSSATNYTEFSSLNFTVEAGETEVISVKVQGASDITGTHAFEITSADYVTTDATVEGSFPITGNAMTYSDVTAGTLTIDDDGSLADPTLGEIGAEVEKFSLAADGENIDLYSVALEQKGSADMPYLENWELYRGSDKLADGTVEGDYVTFDLDTPYTIDDGLTKILSVKVDITSKVDPDDYIDLEVDEAIDVYGVGQTFGYGVGVIDSLSGDNVQVQGGTITLVDQGPNAADVKSGGNDITFLEFSITAKTDITVKDLDLVAYSANSALVSYLDDVKIKDADTGVTLMGPEDPDDPDGAEKMDFTEDFDVAADTTRNLMVTADIDEDATSSATYRISLAMTTSLDGETTVIPSIKDSENNVVTDIIPSTNIVGETMTVAGAYLTVSLAASPGCTINVQNNDKVEALGIVLGAGEAEDITVTDITVHFTAATVEPEDIISAVYLYDSAGTLLAGPETISASSDDVVFDGLALVVSAGGTEKVLVKTDIGTLSAADAFYADIVGDSSGETININAEDEEGSAVTVYDEDLNGSGDWSGDVYLNDPGTLAADQDCLDANVEIELIQTGYLLIENNTDRPSAKIVVAGDTDQALHKFDFTGEYEGFNVEKLTFITTSGSQDNFDSVTLKYPDEDGTTVSQSESFISNSVTFSGMTMYVEKDETATVSVEADFNTIIGGADSGETVDIDWDYSGDIKVVSDSGTVDDDASDTDGFITDVSGEVSAFSADLASYNHLIYNTVLTAGNPSASKTGIESSNETILSFSVVADSADKATIQKILFAVAGTVQTEDEITGTDDFSFYDASDLTTALYALTNVTSDTLISASVTIAATGTAASGYQTLLITDATSTTLAAGDVISIDTSGGADSADVAGVLVKDVDIGATTTTLIISTLADGDVDLSGVVVTTSTLYTSSVKFLNESSLVIPLEDVAAKTIAAGATKYFAVVGDTNGASPASAGTRSLQLKISSGYYFEWQDDELTSNIQTVLLKTFPLTGGTLTYSYQSG